MEKDAVGQFQDELKKNMQALAAKHAAQIQELLDKQRREMEEMTETQVFLREKQGKRMRKIHMMRKSEKKRPRSGIVRTP